MAEDEACMAGLEVALDMNAKNLEVYGDSILVTIQFTGEWRVESPELAKHKRYLTWSMLSAQCHSIICRALRINLLMP